MKSSLILVSLVAIFVIGGVGIFSTLPNQESFDNMIISWGTNTRITHNEFIATNDKIIYVSKLMYTNNEQETSLPMSDYDWMIVTSSIDFEKFNALPDVIGCPGCLDGPILWIEISDGSKTKKVTFESPDELSEIKYLYLELQIIENIFYHMENSSNLVDDKISNCSNIELTHIPKTRVKQQSDFIKFHLGEFSDSPIIKNTIDKVDKIGFSLNGLSTARLTSDEFKEYNIFIANKTQDQYPGFTYYVTDEDGDLYIGSSEESYQKDKITADKIFPSGWVNDNLEFLPITYDNKTYDFTNIFLLRDKLPTLLFFGHLMDNYNGDSVIFSEYDMQKIPKVLESIHDMRIMEMPSKTHTNIETDDLSWYFKWFNDKKIEKTGSDIGSDKIRYNDNFYEIDFNVC